MPDMEKVILALKIHADGCGYRSHHCDAMECPYRYGDESCDIEEMCRDTLELLQEQEAVEPIFEQDSMVCGVCGHEVIWQKMLGDGVWLDEQLDYCPKCGKKVKWE